MNLRFRLLSMVTLIVLSPVYAQEKHTISGTISDAASGETLIGATVAVRELPVIGTSSNAYGYYSLTLPEGTYTLIASYVGYAHSQVKIDLKEDKRLDIRLPVKSEVLDEVVVTSERDNENIVSGKIGTEKMKMQEIRNIPVLLGEQDVIKTLALTPGVKTPGEGSGGMFVRGGNNSQNLILLDEATVFNSNHLLGFFSTFNSDAIKDLTLYKGTAPAQYGGRLSSVMDIKMNEGNNKHFHVGGGIGLISSKLNLEGPVVKDKSSFLVTGRRTYADLFLKLSNDETLNSNRLYFYDLNAKANYLINQNNRIYLSGYFGRDVVEMQGRFGIDWGNITGTLRWNHIWNNKLFSNTSLVFSDYNYKVRVIRQKDEYSLSSEIKSLDLKQEFQYFINSKHTLIMGFFNQFNTITPGQVEVPAGSDINPIDLQERYSLETGAFISHNWKPSEKWVLNYGLRTTVFGLFGPGDFYAYDHGVVTDTLSYRSGEAVKTYVHLEPRITIAFIIDPSSSVKFSYTRNTQNLHLIQNSNSSTPTDIWISSGNNVKPEIGDQVSLGYFRNFSNNQFQFSGEAYYKRMLNQFDLKNGADIRANEFIEGELLFGKGRAYGLELMLKKKAGDLTGWVAYTLSRTEKQIEGINNGNWYPARQDETHAISVVGIYKLSNRWSFSATWVYNTGNAVTFPSGKYEIDGNVEFYYTERNGYRMPAYHRLDLGAAWYFKKTGKFESNLNFSVYNAYGRKNAFIIDFEEDENDPSRTVAVKSYLFTVVPSVTYQFRF